MKLLLLERATQHVPSSSNSWRLDVVTSSYPYFLVLSVSQCHNCCGWLGEKLAVGGEEEELDECEVSGHDDSGRCARNGEMFCWGCGRERPGAGRGYLCGCSNHP